MAILAENRRAAGRRTVMAFPLLGYSGSPSWPSAA